MKEGLVDFTKEDKYLVNKLYEEGCSLKEISEITGLSYYETLFLLRHLVEQLEIEKLVSCETIQDSELLIISDTHLGSIYENIDYIKEVYQYAKKNHIQTILHGGDFIQSTISNVKQELLDEKKQLEYAIKVYPYQEDIKNYILLGNHDYNTLKKGEVYFDILKEREDFVFLGFKRAYLTWQNKLISVCHQTKKYLLPIPSVDNFLNLKGHSHRLSHHKEKSVDIPTLSDDIFFHKKARPGFLVGTMDHKSLELDSYFFKDERLTYEGNILTKKM